MRESLLYVLIALFSSLTVYPGNIYVSAKNGSDTASGTAEAPLLTVGEALKRAREWRRLDAPEAYDDIRIILDGGTYRQSVPLFIRPEDSGTPASATIITSAPDSKAVISGGVSVTGWTRGTDDKRVPARLRDKIWVADAPMNANRIIETRQMYVNGSKAIRASQFAPGKMERMAGFDISDKSITVPAPDIDLSSAKGLEMIVHQRWAIAILRVN